VADNGPYRGGKATLYEGGTRVVALANWPGRIAAGTRVEGLIHVVDLYPTFLNLAGGRLDRGKPLDGVDAWATISRGEPSRRTEVVYNIEPSAAGIRQGDWKLVWRPALPPSAELYNLSEDPYEKTDLAAKHTDKVDALRARLTELAAAMAPPLFPPAAIEASLKLPPAFPEGGR
jgi:arylsulfatase A-like enzyme